MKTKESLTLYILVEFSTFSILFHHYQYLYRMFSSSYKEWLFPCLAFRCLVTFSYADVGKLFLSPQIVHHGQTKEIVPRSSVVSPVSFLGLLTEVECFLGSWITRKPVTVPVHQLASCPAGREAELQPPLPQIVYYLYIIVLGRACVTLPKFAEPSKSMNFSWKFQFVGNSYTTTGNLISALFPQRFVYCGFFT